MKIPDNWIDALFDYGIDLPNRRVFLGDIDEQSCMTVAKGLYVLETLDDEAPVDLFISSYGGSVEHALGIHDIIQTLNCPVHTFAFGTCMSAAPMLLSVGAPGQRWVSPNVNLMFHDWACELEGKGKQIKAWVKNVEDIDGRWLDIITANSNKDRRFWKRLAEKPSDFFFSAQEAIDWGIADHIWQQR